MTREEAISLRHHPEKHLVDRIGWLRAVVLGANAESYRPSLIVGVAAAAARQNDVLIAGVAGAMSMAAGEYVSVSSQSDTENADLARERGKEAANKGGLLEGRGSGVPGSLGVPANRNSIPAICIRLRSARRD